MIILGKWRVLSIIMGSGVGYCVGILFILLGGAELGVREFVVEWICTGLLLLCLYHLCNVNRNKETC
ncbi:hydrogenase subunit MbhD domain-containing protein [Staphylococcus saprophyticus]|uniref:hydrogenase subunit MbhD domain-containing protein n=1 Tax=Staphylococcus saprophyticus TaxID=29385 RepID=UPI002980E146|nr:hydrogenase subunit MbhD domain-containing protein [Staphylococcus saprophyticus]